MTAPVPPAGPPCDLCGNEPPIMSVMNLADYSTVQVGPGCLPEFLAGLLASVRGPETPAEDPAAEPEPEPLPESGGPLPAPAGPRDGQSAVTQPRRARARK